MVYIPGGRVGFGVGGLVGFGVEGTFFNGLVSVNRFLEYRQWYSQYSFDKLILREHSLKLEQICYLPHLPFCNFKLYKWLQTLSNSSNAVVAGQSKICAFHDLALWRVPPKNWQTWNLVQSGCGRI